MMWIMGLRANDIIVTTVGEGYTNTSGVVSDWYGSEDLDLSTRTTGNSQRTS